MPAAAAQPFLSLLQDAYATQGVALPRALLQACPLDDDAVDPAHDPMESREQDRVNAEAFIVSQHTDPAQPGEALQETLGRLFDALKGARPHGPGGRKALELLQAARADWELEQIPQACNKAALACAFDGSNTTFRTILALLQNSRSASGITRFTVPQVPVRPTLRALQGGRGGR